jgi:hypothetical protein
VNHVVQGLVLLWEEERERPKEKRVKERKEPKEERIENN